MGPALFALGLVALVLAIQVHAPIRRPGELAALLFAPAWLAGELKATPALTPIAIVSHVPFLTVGTIGFTPELRRFPQAAKMLAHVDAYEVLNLLEAHPNVKLCLSGHTHQTETIRLGTIDSVNRGAVCGLWWKGNARHTSEGYNLVDLYDDGTYATEYISYGWKLAR